MKPIFTLFIALLFASCQRECYNTNPVFDNNPPESKVYQDELVRQLGSDSHNDISYTLEKYEEKGGVPYLHINLKDDGLCAIAVVKVMHWDENAFGIRDKKGKGYYGAGLLNLKINCIQTGRKTELIYKSIDAILD